MDKNPNNLIWVDLEMTGLAVASARICEIAWASTPPVSGRLPSQAGVHPPLEFMNAIVNHLTPVALMTVLGAGGLPHPS